MPVTPQDTFDWLLKYAIKAAEDLGSAKADLETQTARADTAESAVGTLTATVTDLQSRMDAVESVQKAAEEFRATVAPAAPADSLPADGQ
jgi:outer membrane murein-binding lipoprotein Lpp